VYDLPSRDGTRYVSIRFAVFAAAFDPSDAQTVINTNTDSIRLYFLCLCPHYSTSLDTYFKTALINQITQEK